MLNAIAVYTREDNRFLKKIFSKPAQAGFHLFSEPNLLADLETLFLPQVIFLIQDNEIRHSTGQDQHFYLAKLSRQNFIVAISARKRLDNSELYYLIQNISHVYLRGAVVKTTLNDIILNPLGYTGRDVLIARTQENVNEVKQKAIKLIEQLLERQENIDRLSERAIDLLNVSTLFEQKTRRGCCGW